VNKILSINEVTVSSEDIKQLDDYCGYSGYEVVTEKEKIYVLIADGQCCDESWGYLDTNNNSNEFIGQELKSVEIVDEALTTKEIPEIEAWDCGGAVFVNFTTTKGDVFQLVVYNGHNGYYGHDIAIIRNNSVLLRDTL